jgi:ribosome recycling factor
MPIDILADHHADFQKAIEFLKNDIASLRTGRATPALVDTVMVEAYGSRQALQGLASISAPDARTLLIEPWDKSILKDIERGIQEAKLNINPIVTGQQIRISLPALTEEGRKSLVKLLGERMEHARKSIRNVRDEAKVAITKAEKDKLVSEDEKYRLLDGLDKVAAGFNERIKGIGEEKEKEIMTM